MYNIHSHYENIFSYLKTITAEPVLLHFYPFGSINYENIEYMHCNGSGNSECPLVLCFDQEPLTIDIMDLIDKIKLDWGSQRNIILLNTELESQLKNSIVNEFRIKRITDCNYFFHIFAAADWYRGYYYNSNLIAPSQRKILKKYITFNRITGNSRAYRSLFVAELAKHDLLDYGHVSYSKICPVHGHYADTIYDLNGKHKVPINTIDSYVDILNTIDKSLRIDFIDHEYIPNGSQEIFAIPELMESFLHVVTETCFWEQKTHLTEKIFKPIVCKQPFVLLGCSNNLKYLRSYGFKTFDRWIDESYDSIEDPIERVKAVVDVIKKITALSNKELEDLLKEMQPLLDYNYNLFYSSDFINDTWTELTLNLKEAHKRSVLMLPVKT